MLEDGMLTVALPVSFVCYLARESITVHQTPGCTAMPGFCYLHTFQ